MKKNILIYMTEDKLKPIGGPAGYLYNLYTQFKIDKIENISFLKCANSKEQYRDIYTKLPNVIKHLYQIIIRNKNYKSLTSNERKNNDIDFNQYDLIHFHSTRDLYKERGNLIDFNGIVVLTSHTPKPPHLEAIEDNYTKLERFLYTKKRLDTFKYMDEYAFDNADYIVFPCEDAEEPYYNNWGEYHDIKERNEYKYKYLLSGTMKRCAKNDRKSILEKFGIPEDAFVISYVGRHNEVKGYDILKEIGEKILNENNKVYFLIAGEEKPLTGIKHERWIEVGWTNDPHSIISASDVFVLPNKETYFDLVMLEVLSLGKIVVASNTGGNKYFNKIGAKGIFLYDDMEEAITLIKSIKELPIEEKIHIEEGNKKIFNDKFSNNVFAKNYLELINTLD